MHFLARPPTPVLARFVEYLWASQGAPAHSRERVVPTGSLSLAVSLTEETGCVYDSVGRPHRLSGAGGVSGAYRRPFSFDTRDNASLVGVHFRPGCAGAVLGLPPGELTDRHVSLDELWGRRPAHEFRERLCAASTTEHRFALLEAELVARLGRWQAHPAVPHALDVLARSDASVRDIAKDARFSQRKLIEIFTTAVGLTPKRFGRVLRFRRAITLAHSSAFDWTRIAHQCGYYDQAHLIRDFRELGDVTPSELVRASVHPKEQHQLAVRDRGSRPP